MGKIFIFLLLSTYLMAGCTKEEPLMIKDYFIGLPIKECPSNNSTIGKSISDGITHCYLQRTTYAGFESSSYEIQIYDGLIHAVKLVIRPEQNSIIKTVLTSKYGHPTAINHSSFEWHRGSQILFLFMDNADTQIRLVDRANQTKHQDKLNSIRAKDI